MVKIKEESIHHWSIDQWLEHLTEKGYSQDLSLLKHALCLTELSGHDFAVETGETCFWHGLAMADVLADLGMDLNSLIAAVVYPTVQYGDLSIDVIHEQLGSEVARLLEGVLRMSLLSHSSASDKLAHKKSQLDNWRKMLLAMVDDVRVVLIKLADRLCVMRSMSHMPETIKKHAALETMNIYAPLAHRLGIGAVKWELEDLAFRYLHPNEYKTIAKGLRSKRIERDRYVNWIVSQLQYHIKSLNLSHFSIYGRSKHIHSIYNKMLRKKVPLDEIYDATAVRILVDSSEQCYQVLALVNSLWIPINKEFDDFISNPKPNGYQSLHTAVIGPEDRIFEVQIRTFDMHQRAEMGVAAHWKYKEGSVVSEEIAHEQKISWLREVLAWHQELEKQDSHTTHIEAPVLDDRVYVFTPNYEVIDLSKGSTVLDFAYHLHTTIGHRCRGAKVNGVIAPLHHVLKTADQVEILTGKIEKPSRDWLSNQQAYLTTAKAKAKVMHWFKKQDFDLNVEQGENILERELKQAHIKMERVESLLADFHLNRMDDLLAAVGRGDIKPIQIISRLSITPVPTRVMPQLSTPSTDLSKNIVIEGVGHLLTHFAKCCMPSPGDKIVGYMTLGRGVSIHRQDCINITQASDEQRKRFLNAKWGAEASDEPMHFVIKLEIKAHDRPDLLKSITILITKHNIRIVAMQTQVQGLDAVNRLQLVLEVNQIEDYEAFYQQLLEIGGLISVKKLK
jgi:GTP pyrophosphokinase